MSDIQTIVEELIELNELYCNSMSFYHKDFKEKTEKLWQIAKEQGIFDQVADSYQKHCFEQSHGDNISRDLKCFTDL